jgi:glycosyltransferase involved in cell wall biosynthesis
MSADFSRWAVVGYKDDTGLGRMAADARRVLGLGFHFVAPSERLTDYALNPREEFWLRPDASLEVLRDLLLRVDGILVLERYGWHPRLLEVARELGVATVCVPMWEWFRGDAAEWRFCDLFACPNRFAEKVVRGYGWRNTVVVPWALDLAKLPRRNVSGPARFFVHNAGLVDHDDRKGTRAAIAAFSRVSRPDLRLLVRMQKPIELPRLDPRIEVVVGNLPHPAELYEVGDAFIQPSKMEGLGFMVLEPVACGLPVITTNYPPMNEYVRQPELRCELRWFKRRAFARNWIRHAHLRLPRERSLADRIAWAAENDLAPIAASNGDWATAEFSPTRLRAVWSGLLPAGRRSTRR